MGGAGIVFSTTARDVGGGPASGARALGGLEQEVKVMSVGQRSLLPGPGTGL